MRYTITAFGHDYIVESLPRESESEFIDRIIEHTPQVSEILDQDGVKVYEKQWG